jgi:hypothetical protein
MTDEFDDEVYPGDDLVRDYVRRHMTRSDEPEGPYLQSQLSDHGHPWDNDNYSNNLQATYRHLLRNNPQHMETFRGIRHDYARRRREQQEQERAALERDAAPSREDVEAAENQLVLDRLSGLNLVNTHPARLDERNDDDDDEDEDDDKDACDCSDSDCDCDDERKKRRKQKKPGLLKRIANAFSGKKDKKHKKTRRARARQWQRGTGALGDQGVMPPPLDPGQLVLVKKLGADVQELGTSAQRNWSRVMHEQTSVDQKQRIQTVFTHLKDAALAAGFIAPSQQTQQTGY